MQNCCLWIFCLKSEMPGEHHRVTVWLEDFLSQVHLSALGTTVFFGKAQIKLQVANWQVHKNC